MLKDKKIEYQRQLEEYLEDQKVYDIFEDMMKALIIHKPKDPITYLIKKLTTPESKFLSLVTSQARESSSLDLLAVRGRKLLSHSLSTSLRKGTLSVFQLAIYSTRKSQRSLSSGSKLSSQERPTHTLRMT